MIPPLAEQERIVTAIEEAFSKLDAGEAGLRTVRQLLKRMQDAILTAAVTGRLVPQDPTDTPAAKLLADLNAGPADTAGLAYIPDGWAGVALGDLAEVISGPAFKSTQFKEAGEGTRLLRGENIEPGQLRWRDTRTWPDALLPGHEHLHVEVSDLILAMDRPVISTGLKLAPVRPADLPALLVQRVARIRPKTDCLRSFLLITMQHSRFVSHLLGGQVGTQLPHITLKGIREFTLACPGPEEMARIVAEVERQLSFVEACERAVDVGLARSAGLRRSVLKAAFEGRLVPQDPSDEPASVLLERIRAERAAQTVAKRRARQTA
jgi:type I restriction enzyme S subunit